MVEDNDNFNPDWVSPPGNTILCAIQEKNWTQVQLAKRLGISNKHVNHLIKGKVALTDEMAFRLATVLGSTEQFWLRREAQYRQRLAKLHAEERYRNWQDWLDEFPINELKKAGILPHKRFVNSVKPEFVELLLRFFGVATPDEWKNNYLQMQGSFQPAQDIRSNIDAGTASPRQGEIKSRKMRLDRFDSRKSLQLSSEKIDTRPMRGHFRRAYDNTSNLAAVTAWLRQGEIKAEEIEVDLFYDENNLLYSRRKFKNALMKIRDLTNNETEKFQLDMEALCLEAGVILALVPSIPKAKVSGVARWYKSGFPMIQLSLCGKSNDRFWFAFYHEAAHILLHAKNKKDIFLDDEFSSEETESVEMEANEFAENLLIPSKYKSSLPNLNSRHEIKEFASKVGIHPGIVVGRLQKEKIISSRQLNDLKEIYEINDG